MELPFNQQSWVPKPWTPESIKGTFYPKVYEVQVSSQANASYPITKTYVLLVAVLLPVGRSMFIVLCLSSFHIVQLEAAFPWGTEEMIRRERNLFIRSVCSCLSVCHCRPWCCSSQWWFLWHFFYGTVFFPQAKENVFQTGICSPPGIFLQQHCAILKRITLLPAVLPWSSTDCDRDICHCSWVSLGYCISGLTFILTWQPSLYNWLFLNAPPCVFDLT